MNDFALNIELSSVVESTFRNGATFLFAIFRIHQKEKFSRRFPMQQFVLTKVYTTLLLPINFQNVFFRELKGLFQRISKRLLQYEVLNECFFKYSIETVIIPVK